MQSNKLRGALLVNTCFRELSILIYLEHTEVMIAIMFNINIDNVGIFEWVYTYGFVKISS